MSEARKRTPWSCKLTPIQKAAVAREYLGGSSIRALMKTYGISRSTLYRYLEQEPKSEDDYDAGHWRIECQRLTQLVAAQALELHDLKRAASEQKA